MRDHWLPAIGAGHQSRRGNLVVVGASHISLRSARTSLGNCHGISSLRLFQAHQRTHARIHRGPGGIFRLGPDTRTCLRTQGNHRNSEQELVAHQVVEHQQIAIVRDGIGVTRPVFVGIVHRLFAAGGVACEREGAQLLANDDLGGLKAPSAGNRQLGLQRAANHHVSAALGQPQIELTVGEPRTDLCGLEGGANPRRAHRQPKVATGRVEVMDRD